MEKKQLEALREQLTPALQCKHDEFRLLGYDHVTMEQIWNCLLRKKWKHVGDDKKLYELVSDILSLSIGEYMAFLTAESYQKQRTDEGSDLAAILNELL